MKMKTGLILEGGGMRAIFTSAILDSFMNEGIEFEAMTGVSAGVLFGSNFKSKQFGRALRYNMRFAGCPEYMSYKSLFTTGNYVNINFSYNLLPRQLDPFDYQTYAANPMKFYAVCTDAVNGGPIYHEIPDAEGDGLTWMRASASMPVYAKPVHIDGYTLLDGGISDSIPLRFMHQKGYTRNVVILTQPTTFRKSKSHVDHLLRLLLPRYPKIAEMMSVRHQMYNAQLDYVEQSRQSGNTFVITPDTPLAIGRLEMNRDKIQAIYDAGTKKAQEILPALKAFISCE